MKCRGGRPYVFKKNGDREESNKRPKGKNTLLNLGRESSSWISRALDPRVWSYAILKNKSPKVVLVINMMPRK